MATHKGITPTLGLLVHLARVTQTRQLHPSRRHRQVPHACAAQPCPGLAIQHRWTLSFLVLTHTQHLGSGGLAVPAWPQLPQAAAAPCLPPSAVQHGPHHSPPGLGLLGHSHTSASARTGLLMLPHTHLTPAHVHSSLWLSHRRALQTRLMGISGHPHLQLWSTAWLKVASHRENLFPPGE